MTDVITVTEANKTMTHSVLMDNGKGFILREDGKLTIYGTPEEAATTIINSYGAKAQFIAVNLLHVDMPARKMEWLGQEDTPKEFIELQTAFNRLTKLLPFW